MDKTRKQAVESHDHLYPEEEETKCKLIFTQILKFEIKISHHQNISIVSN